MRYDAELRFFFRVLKNLNLPVRILSASRERMEGEELDIYSILYSELSYEDIFNHIIASCKPKRIYRVTDEFFCSYLIFRLPEIPEDSYILIGPYTKFHIEKEEILTNAERLSLPPGLYPQVEKFYMNLTRISDPNALAALINTLAMVLWESPEEFAWEDLDISQVDFFPIRVKDSFVSEFEDPYQEQMKLEKYYRGENEFLEIVSRGQMDKAEDLMKNYTLDRLEQRLSDSVRDVKNYSIIFNTLLRKAAEKGGVHPIHIHKISSGYAKEIELLTSAEAAMKLHKRMVHKYCLLVKNHSLKSYSPLVKKVITNVDADLTADLTLKRRRGC